MECNMHKLTYTQKHIHRSEGKVHIVVIKNEKLSFLRNGCKLRLLYLINKYSVTKTNYPVISYIRNLCDREVGLS